MRLDLSVEIAFPRDRVFKAYRDNLPDLVPYLPNVRDIIVQTRSDDGATTHLLNRWKGGGEIPSVVRKFISQELLEWDDHATWHQEQFTCDWRTVVPAFKDAVESRGHNRYEDLGGRTRVVITGELNVDAGKVKGVPRLLSGTVSPAIEAFLVNAIRPNLLAVSKGVEKFLQAHPA